MLVHCGSTAAMAQQGKQLYSRLVSEARSVSESACIEALSKALRGAALEGHIRATEKLLIDGADPSIAMSSGWNALHGTQISYSKVCPVLM